MMNAKVVVGLSGAMLLLQLALPSLAGTVSLSQAKSMRSEFNTASYRTSTDDGDIKVVFIGNSITLHGVNARIGWTNVWGMAASAPEKDYVHLVASGIAQRTGRKPKLRVRNLAEFERGFETYDFSKIRDLVDFEPDVLVVALGENVPNLTTERERLAYTDGFKRLLGQFMRSGVKPRVVVRGVFWPVEWKDVCMANAAKSCAVPFVKADFGRDPKTKAIGLFANRDVANHPGDSGMAAISRAILEGLFPKQ